MGGEPGCVLARAQASPAGELDCSGPRWGCARADDILVSNARSRCGEQVDCYVQRACKDRRQDKGMIRTVAS